MLQNTAAICLTALVAAACAIGSIQSDAASDGRPTKAAPPASDSASPSSTPIQPDALTAPVLTNWHQARTIEAPGDGAVMFADGSVWAVNRMDGGFTGDLPNGEIYRIDPATGAIADTVEHARGGFPTSGLGAIWYINAEFGQTVTRLDLETLKVDRFRTSTSEDPVPEAVVVAGDWLWVGNNHDGTVVKINPQTYEVEQTLVLTEPGGYGVRGKAATDGTSVWFGISRTGEIVRIDAATGREMSRIRLPLVPHEHLPAGMAQSESSVPEQLVFAGQRLYALTVEHIYAIDVSTIGQERIVADVRTGLWPPFLTVDDEGNVWSFIDDPAALFQIDAETAQIIGRVPLDIPDDSFRDFTAGGGSLWVRLDGSLVEVTTDP